MANASVYKRDAGECFYCGKFVTAHLERHPGLQVKQVEYCGGDLYGMTIIVVYEYAENEE